MQRRTVGLCSAAGILILGTLGLWQAGLRLNISPSYPPGLYRLTPGRGQVGDLVTACLPGRWSRYGIERGYLGFGRCPALATPVLKRLAAQVGDRVTITDRVLINGVEQPRSRLKRQDAQGRPLPAAVSEVVAPGQVWLLSDYNADSFDSRYFGPIPARQISAVAQPLLTWTRGTEQ